MLGLGEEIEEVEGCKRSWVKSVLMIYGRRKNTYAEELLCSGSMEAWKRGIGIG